MKNEKSSINNFIAFYAKAEKLKSTMRHSWLTNGRQESSAEHSWMLGLLAIVLSGELETKVDILKVVKMVTVHDLAEAITGDIPSHEISSRKENKYQAEKDAFKELAQDLPKKTAEEIVSLWEEFEENETVEAKFANALDKLEATLQHNVAPIETWDQGDFDIGPYYKEHFFDFDAFIRELKDAADRGTMEKVIDAKAESRVDRKHLERYQNEK